MKCNNCEFFVTTELSFCIQRNICPRCGKEIMSSDKLESYLGLLEDFKRNIPLTDDVDLNASIIERVAAHLLAFYEFSHKIKAKKVSKINMSQATKVSSKRQEYNDQEDEDGGIKIEEYDEDVYIDGNAPAKNFPVAPGRALPTRQEIDPDLSFTKPSGDSGVVRRPPSMSRPSFKRS
jgi:hypothetical protein